MRLLVEVISFGLLFFTTPSHSQELKTNFLKYDKETVLRLGIVNPAAVESKGDVIFLHGFSDRLDNHGPLFRELADNGLRVIAFDYPSHGETKSRSLGWYSFDELLQMIAYVETATVENRQRPLFIIGWSTGGLLAVRMAQMGFTNGLSRRPQAMVLYAPGVSVSAIPGDWGVVTEETLTSHPQVPHVGPIKPKSPFLKPVFSLRLLANSIFSQYQEMPEKPPILTFIGGEKADVYANSMQVKKWVISQRQHNSQMLGIQCLASKHELDNEFEPLGQTVRRSTTAFLISVLGGLQAQTNYELPPLSSCEIF